MTNGLHPDPPATAPPPARPRLWSLAAAMVAAAARLSPEDAAALAAGLRFVVQPLHHRWTSATTAPP